MVEAVRFTDRVALDGDFFFGEAVLRFTDRTGGVDEDGGELERIMDRRTGVGDEAGVVAAVLRMVRVAEPEAGFPPPGVTGLG